MEQEARSKEQAQKGREDKGSDEYWRCELKGEKGDDYEARTIRGAKENTIGGKQGKKCSENDEKKKQSVIV